MTIRRLTMPTTRKEYANGSEDHLPDGFNQGVNKKVIFGEVPVCPVFHKFGQQVIVPLSGKNDNGDLLVHFPDFLQGFQTIKLVLPHTGKHMVQYNKSGILIKVLQALLSGLETDHLVIMPALKGIFQQVQNYLVVVNEENRPGHCGQNAD